MRFSQAFYAFVALTLSLNQGAIAGAGAFVNACIAVPPGQDRKSVFDVTFTAGGKTSSCMSVQGKHIATMTVTEPAITCTGLGYVEQKTRKRCFFKYGKWDLSYTDTLGLSGGKTGTVWSPGAAPGQIGNQVTLSGYSPRTRVCRNSTVVCDEGEGGPVVEWKIGTQGPIFIIFQPFAADLDV